MLRLDVCIESWIAEIRFPTRTKVIASFFVLSGPPGTFDLTALPVQSIGLPLARHEL